MQGNRYVYIYIYTLHVYIYIYIYYMYIYIHICVCLCSFFLSCSNIARIILPRRHKCYYTHQTLTLVNTWRIIMGAAGSGQPAHGEDVDEPSLQNPQPKQADPETPSQKSKQTTQAHRTPQPKTAHFKLWWQVRTPDRAPPPNSCDCRGKLIRVELPWHILTYVVWVPLTANTAKGYCRYTRALLGPYLLLIEGLLLQWYVNQAISMFEVKEHASKLQSVACFWGEFSEWLHLPEAGPCPGCQSFGSWI